MVKKKIEKKEKDKILGMKKNTALTVGALIVVVILLNNYNNVPTGQASKGQIFEKQLTNYLRYDPINNIPGKVFDGLHTVYFYGVTINDAALITVDCLNDDYDPYDDPSKETCPIKKAHWGGCSENDRGTFVGSGVSNAYGIPCGTTVRVCSASYDRQEADLDLIPEAC